MPSPADRYDAFLFDLDGVLYRAGEPVPGAAEAVARLRAGGKGLAFVTNNSSRTPEEVATRLRRAGVEAAPEEVETSALSTADVLAERRVREAFVVGEGGLRTALAARGIALLDGDPETAEAVVVGWDRGADYAKLKTASLLVQRGAAFLATNADASYPAPDGLWPGAGALLAAIETTTGVRAEVIGKPHAPIFRAALARAGGGRPLVIGDRLDTDIAGAERLGWASFLVLSGISGRADLDGSPYRPDFVGDDLGSLFDDHDGPRAPADAG
jgi:glycerol-1-phosphatase